MEINEVVIDSELFRKVSSEDLVSRDFHEFVCTKIRNNEFIPSDMHECYCFRDILSSIKNEKCVLAYNKAIKLEYIKLIKNCPDDIKIKLNAVFSREKCCRNIEDIWDYQNRDFFKGTLLEPKIQYLNVAYFSNKLIVSTKNSVDEICTGLLDNLSIVGITYRDAQYVKEKLDKQR